MTAVQNTDYSSTKGALCLFFDSLRQELVLKDEPVLITNVYPYIVDTKLFDGFDGLALYVIPLLRQDRVAEIIFDKAFTYG